jgi:hypothetical protein
MAEIGVPVVVLARFAHGEDQLADLCQLSASRRQRGFSHRIMVISPGERRFLIHLASHLEIVQFDIAAIPGTGLVDQPQVDAFARKLGNVPRHRLQFSRVTTPACR